MEFLYVLGAGLGMLVILGIIRSHRNNRAVDEFVSQWCRSNGVPDAPFDIKATTREVINGTRPGIPRDGQWWIAKGIEFAGRPSQTRLTFEGSVETFEDVQSNIFAMYDENRGPSEAPPHLADSHVILLCRRSRIGNLNQWCK